MKGYHKCGLQMSKKGLQRFYHDNEIILIYKKNFFYLKITSKILCSLSN